MASTPQSQAIQTANLIMSLSAQVLSIYQQLVTLDAFWTDNAAATFLAALSTTALNADGSPGVADGSPNTSHPINLTANPSLSRAVSFTQISQAKTILDGIVSYVGGQAVATQASARPILNAVTGG
jgi:hypothetical protein